MERTHKHALPDRVFEGKCERVHLLWKIRNDAANFPFLEKVFVLDMVLLHHNNICFHLLYLQLFEKYENSLMRKATKILNSTSMYYLHPEPTVNFYNDIVFSASIHLHQTYLEIRDQFVLAELFKTG